MNLPAAKPAVPATVIERQHRASDPGASAWVSANAGSGKTHVLAQRVIRLLLDGCDPAKILCLTFTKAAAANMATRVFDTLAGWVALDDEALDRKIRETGMRHVDARLRTRARRLFALALETPGGLKVQTIHGFCTRLLQQFPFEANVAAKFSVLDDNQQLRLLEQAELAVLLEAIARPDGDAGRALATATLAAGDHGFREALREIVAMREQVGVWIGGDPAAGLARAKADLSQMLGIGVDDTPERIEQEFFDKAIIPPDEWPALMTILTGGSKTDQAHVPRLKGAQGGALKARIESFLSVFCTAELSPRKSIVTKAIRDAHPALAARLDEEQRRVCALIERRRAVAVRDRTLALLTLADTAIRHYQREKERRGLLDYEDLIARTRELLTRVEAAWVHYKLDLGIDHLLIDEAQDTSPEQWDIVRHLVSEFTAGLGARGAMRRSIFAVGDDKQSIFSFQGAAPDAFDDMRRFFERAFDDPEAFRPIRFDYSFRSAPAVLEAVDIVFAQPQAFAGLSTDRAPTAHSAVREAAPGLVELWPLVEPGDATEPDPWDAPFDAQTRTSPRVKLAQRIAANVKTWIERGEPVGDDRHPVRAGDVLVLVRQRGPLFEAIIRALKNAGIPVAGADRLVLTQHIAVMDLLALADAILLPQDDLALAIVLKSPLFGLDEEALYALAYGREATLRAALAEQRPDLSARLDALARLARDLTPFAFYAELLGAGGARKAILSRLGHEANDALDEFLNLALDYESGEIPSLQGFVAWMRTASASIKRDMEIARDEVRVMTVHGAKGLEAPIVILADTTTRPEGPSQFQPRILSIPAQNAAPGTPDRLVWMPGKNDDTPPLAAARAAAQAAAQDEYRRLLYVAMTRAADRLIVCGAAGAKAMPAGCWYELVAQGLSGAPGVSEVPADDGDGSVLRYRKFDAPMSEYAAAKTASAAPPDFPAWLTQPLPTPAAPAAVTPSSADEGPARPVTAASREARKTALRRGSLVHRLLQSLPDLEAEKRKAAGGNYLAHAAREFSATEREEILAQAFAVLDDRRFAALFARGSRSEVPIAGRIDLPGKPGTIVNGQIDRIAVTDTEVLIADYKTNRPPPRSLAAVPESYLRQLALYHVLLTNLYPGKTVRAALIWTAVPDLMEIPDEALDAALAAFTAA